MKLAKISLAALVALGAFSTLNATPLEEAIKDVDFSGFARYQYTDNKLNINNKKRWKSTRLNSSHPVISYAVFCLKKKIK